MNSLDKLARSVSYAAALLGLLIHAPLVASEPVSLHTGFVQGAQSQQDIVYTGRLDGIRDNAATVLIDDTVLEVSQLVTLNGSRVPRDRLPFELEEGQTIEFRLHQTDKGQRLVISIDTP